MKNKITSMVLLSALLTILSTSCAPRHIAPPPPPPPAPPAPSR
ncbi:hypothetical protein HDF24_07940 [Mucilaginibacter sp. X4EP1]|nr:hypothetical protein [Mucilaginibacter sp. X4EP1]MCS3814246.1 hypothetical protein [Mucilaginibacter sp. X4EP1]